jgi:hypothetical protein
MAVSNNMYELEPAFQRRQTLPLLVADMVFACRYNPTEDLILASPRRRFRTGVRWQYVSNPSVAASIPRSLCGMCLV